MNLIPNFAQIKETDPNYPHSSDICQRAMKLKIIINHSFNENLSLVQYFPLMANPFKTTLEVQPSNCWHTI